MANKATEFAKRQAEKLKKFIIRKVLKWAIIIGGIALGAFAFIALVCAVFDAIKDLKIDNQQYVSEYSSTSQAFEVSQTLGGVIYQRYADQSFYYTMSKPSDEDEQNEINTYSGKGYKDLDGIDEIKLTQGSYVNGITDIDGYEDAVKISAGILSRLDENLNGAGKKGYYYPEQFVKALYVGDSCDLTADDLDISTCKLGDLTQAVSKTKYKRDDSNNGLYVIDTENVGDKVIKENEDEETDISDYGLGSLVHYQAYFQPSRIDNYRLETIVDFNPDWKYGDSKNDIIVNKTWRNLDEEEQKAILDKYVWYEKASNKKKSNNSEGIIDGDKSQTLSFGIYDVEEQIVFKDWAPAYYKNNDYVEAKDEYNAYKDLARGKTNIDEIREEWGKKDPYISTGVLETSISYAIDKALMYIGPVDLGVQQVWTDIMETTHDEVSLYVKDYERNNTKDFEMYDEELSQYANNYIDVYKRVYINGKFKGYAKEDPVWTPASADIEEKEVPDYDSVDAQAQGKCAGGYPGVQNPAPCQCNASNPDMCNTKTVYKVHYEPGYWTFKIVRDTNFQVVDREEKATATVEHDTDYFDKKSDAERIKNSLNGDRYKNDSSCAWKYEPTFLYKVTGIAKGTLQTFLVSHSGSSIKTPSAATEYLENYIKEYKAFIPHDSDGQTFACYSGQSPIVSQGDGTSSVLDIASDMPHITDTTTQTNSGDWVNPTTNPANPNGTTQPQINNTNVPTTEPDGFVENTQNIAVCAKNNLYSIAINPEKETMKTLGVDEISLRHLDKIDWILGLDDEDTNMEVVDFTPETIEKMGNLDPNIGTVLSEIDKTYGASINKWANLYGIDSSLVRSIIFTSGTYDGKEWTPASNLTGITEDTVVGTKINVNRLVAVKGWNRISSSSNETEDIIYNSSPYNSDTAIKWCCGKLQTILKRRDGNLPLALLEYKLGKEVTDKVIKVYAQQQSLAEYTVKGNKYDIGWYHYISEVASKPDKYHITVNNGANVNEDIYFVGNVIHNSQKSRFVWNKKGNIAHAALTLITNKENIISTVWNISSLEDKTDAHLGKVTDPKLIKALSFLTQDNAANYKKYWQVLTLGQKKWNSAIYIDNTTAEKKYDPKPKNTKTFDFVKSTLNDTGTKYVIKEALGFDGDVLGRDMDILSEEYWVSKLGFVKVKPDYKEFLGSSLQSPTNSFETLLEIGYNKDKDGGVQYSDEWVIETEEDVEVYPMTASGHVFAATDNRVIVAVDEEEKVLITYDGLKDVRVKEGDPVGSVAGKLCGENSDETHLGLSSGKVGIKIWKDGDYYDMHQFYENYVESANISSMLFMSSGKALGKRNIIPADEREAMWSMIEQNLKISGACMDGQCTEFTNWMVQERWGEQILAAYGTFLPVNGDGVEKVDRLKAVYGDILTDVKTGLSDFGDSGTDIAFSWGGGEHGHTGWIEEFKIDPSMEGGGYVIMSDGNIGEAHDINIKCKYTWDQWQAAHPDASISGNVTVTYIGLANSSFTCPTKKG